MKRFLLFNPATGAGVQTVSVREVEVAQLAQALDVGYIEVSGDVSDSTHFVVDGVAVPFPLAPSQVHTWDWGARAWGLPPHSMLDVVARKCADIDAARDRARYSGITYNGVRFDSDMVSTSNITGWTAAVTAGIPLPPGFTWRSMDNQDIPFTEADVLALAALAVNKATACYNRAWQLKGHVSALNDYESIINYDITTGWPE